MKKRLLSILLGTLLIVGMGSVSSHAYVCDHDIYLYNRHFVYSHTGPCWASNCTITYNEYYNEFRCRNCDYAYGVSTTETSHSRHHHP